MTTPPLRWLLPLACALLAVPAHALYKIVGPDGRVTYSDTPPAGSNTRAAPVPAAGGDGGGISLPYALRQATSRYPATLYTAAGCAPCDSARAWLRERGIPFAEKTVSSNEDLASYTRLTGGTSLPALTIGSQVLRGLEREQWATYLDTAGYPQASQLPPNYRYPAAVPLVTSKEAAAPAAAAAPAPAAPPPTATGGFRF
jgi:glutaredoxin